MNHCCYYYCDCDCDCDCCCEWLLMTMKRTCWVAHWINGQNSVENHRYSLHFPGGPYCWYCCYYYCRCCYGDEGGKEMR